MAKRKSFSPEFKHMVVNMLHKKDKPASIIALEFDIPMSRLYKWEKDIQLYGQQAFQKTKKKRTLIHTPSPAPQLNGDSIPRQKAPAKNIDHTKLVLKLERELHAAREENEILRKTVAVLSRR